MIEPGHKIKLFFKNGIIEEGYVQYWSNNQATLKSINSDNLLIIFNVQENIMAAKIILETDDEESKSLNITYNKNELSIEGTPREDIDYEQYKAPTHEQRIKKLAELRSEAKELEQEKVKKQLTSFTATGALPNMVNEDNYGLPKQFFLQGPARINPSKKDR